MPNDTMTVDGQITDTINVADYAGVQPPFMTKPIRKPIIVSVPAPTVYGQPIIVAEPAPQAMPSWLPWVIGGAIALWLLKQK